MYSRLALPDKHAAATSSRPLFLHDVARKTEHGAQTKLTMTSSHGKAGAVMRTLSGMSDLLKEFRKSAEQFAQDERWRLLLRLICKKFYDRIGLKVLMPSLA